MTAPNDVAALVERLRSHMGKADMGEVLKDCRLAASALKASEAKIAALISENATAWQMFASEAEKMADEMELNLSLEATVATQATTIAALQAEVERAKEDERDRLFALVKDSPFTPASYFLYNQQGAMLPDERRVARSASRKENTP